MQKNLRESSLNPFKETCATFTSKTTTDLTNKRENSSVEHKWVTPKQNWLKKIHEL